MSKNASRHYAQRGARSVAGASSARARVKPSPGTPPTAALVRRKLAKAVGITGRFPVLVEDQWAAIKAAIERQPTEAKARSKRARILKLLHELDACEDAEKERMAAK